MALKRTLRWQRLFSSQRQTTQSRTTPLGSYITRPFSSSPARPTDGVFRALSENRVQTPWVEAFERQQNEGHDPTKPSGPPLERDLTPRKMSDSYHSVVRARMLTGGPVGCFDTD